MLTNEMRRLCWKFSTLAFLLACLAAFSSSTFNETALAAACIQDCETSESACYTDCFSSCDISQGNCDACLTSCRQMAFNCFRTAVWCQDSDPGIKCTDAGFCCSNFGTLTDTSTNQQFPGYTLRCKQFSGGQDCIQCPPGTTCPSDGANPCNTTRCEMRLVTLFPEQKWEIVCQ